jgi:hypothetical protein
MVAVAPRVGVRVMVGVEVLAATTAVGDWVTVVSVCVVVA